MQTPHPHHSPNSHGHTKRCARDSLVLVVLRQHLVLKAADIGDHEAIARVVPSDVGLQTKREGLVERWATPGVERSASCARRDARGWPRVLCHAVRTWAMPTMRRWALGGRNARVASLWPWLNRGSHTSARVVARRWWLAASSMHAAHAASRTVHLGSFSTLHSWVRKSVISPPQHGACVTVCALKR